MGFKRRFDGVNKVLTHESNSVIEGPPETKLSRRKILNAIAKEHVINGAITQQNQSTNEKKSCDNIPTADWLHSFGRGAAPAVRTAVNRGRCIK